MAVVLYHSQICVFVELGCMDIQDAFLFDTKLQLLWMASAQKIHKKWIAEDATHNVIRP